MKLSVRLPRRKNNNLYTEENKENTIRKVQAKCHVRQKRENLDLVEVAKQANGRR